MLSRSDSVNMSAREFEYSAVVPDAAQPCANLKVNRLHI